MPDKIPDAKILSWVKDLEEPTLDQVKKVTTLPFIFGDIALMPDAHVGKGSTIGSVIATKGAVIPSAVGVDLGCFVGKTKVPLLNGTQKTLKEMSESDEEYWVYSYDIKNKKIVPGKARALKTRSNAELIKVTVSGGEEIICTPDHKFLLRDGMYKEAKDLLFNESLMPLYRKWQMRDGYESCSTGSRDSRNTHKLVNEHFNGELSQGYIVHHRDHNHFNNDPSNLEVMSRNEHDLHHGKYRGFPNDDPEFQKKRLEGVRKHLTEPGVMEKKIQTATQNIKKYMEENPEKFKEDVSQNGERGRGYLIKFNTSPRDCDVCGETQNNPSSLRWHKEKQHSESNHKVINIERLNKKENVYCLQVEKYHNFALAAGVFVHNCGMIAVRSDLTSHNLPDDLSWLHTEITQAVPSGVGKENKQADLWHGNYRVFAESNDIFKGLEISEQEKSKKQIGTLGSGNHFVEICLDEEDRVWIVLHSGSRGVGKEIADRHISNAKDLMKKYFIDIPDPDLAYLVQGTPEYDRYIAEMLWAQDYALANRSVMISNVKKALKSFLHRDITYDKAINCHHNFCEIENHRGQNVLVTRKGAIRAREGDLGVIPGSMGTASYIIEGKGNPASFSSCSHGAGRRMSRSQARKELDAQGLKDAMEGKTWNNNTKDLIDEDPRAYKDIDVVMEQQKDLVTIKHKLHQILNYKGV